MGESNEKETRKQQESNKKATRKQQESNKKATRKQQESNKKATGKMPVLLISYWVDFHQSGFQPVLSIKKQDKRLNLSN
jgi:hypothetical protein